MPNRVLVVVGARPNFVKMAPLLHALQGGPVTARLLHTGQHYDHSLSGAFFEQLSLPQPDSHLGVGSGSHAQQTADVLVGVEQELLCNPADAIIVAGDVNSTMAAALAAAKLGVAVIHLESGLRSRDWSMPEEVNRVVTDRVSDLLLCPSADAAENLRREGVAERRISLVGNTMIDTLTQLRASAEATAMVSRLGLAPRGYALVTLHRPALVDDGERLADVVDALGSLAGLLPVVMPVHPRTRARLGDEHPALQQLMVLEPLEYLQFVSLEAAARLVITDSGGVQEETSALGVPCVTYRSTTERPITTELGTNRIVGMDPEAMLAACEGILRQPMPVPPRIPLWDGHAGQRAADAVTAFLARGV